MGGIVIALTRALPTDATLFSINAIVPEFIALLVAIPLALVALQLITARDSRRFAAGFVLAAGVWFVVLYPNIAALPLPSRWSTPTRACCRPTCTRSSSRSTRSTAAARSRSQTQGSRS